MDVYSDILALPEDVVPVSKPSKIIEKLYAKRRREHDEMLILMQRRKEEIIQETNERIQRETDQLRAKLGDKKFEMDTYMSDIKDDLEKNLELMPVSSETITEKIEQTQKKMKTAVVQYHTFIKTMERNRSEKIKLLFKEFREKFSSISHILPLELEKFFEEEILVANQFALNNYEIYSQEVRDFELEIACSVKIWNEKLNELTEDLKAIFKHLAKKSTARFHSFFIADVERLTVKDIQEEIKKIRSIHSQLLTSISSESMLPVQSEEVENWLKDIQKMLAALDQSASRIVRHYKSIIIILFNRFFAEFEDLKASMGKTGLIDKSKIEDFQSEIYAPEVEQLKIKVRADLEKLQEVWHQSIEDMEKSLLETYRFLKVAAHLWDRHFQRIENAQVLVLQDLANTVEKNSRSVNFYEAKMNILIDKVRQSPDEKKLKTNYVGTVALLDEMTKNYSSNHASEIVVLQKYKTLIEVEVEVLTAELQRFLIVHPPDAERDPKKQRKRASQISEIELDPNEVLLPSQILYCIFHVDAVKNWMFGLWEAVNQYMNVSKSEILSAADDWMTKNTEKVKERLMVKLAFHKPRYERLKYSIFQKRLSELEKHSNRFTSHKMAVEKEIIHLRNQQAEEFKQCLMAADNFKIEAQKIFKLAQDSQNSHQVQNLIKKLQVNTKKDLEGINNVGEYCKDMYYGFHETLRISNYLYLKAIRLFNENGNYCYEELEVLRKNLTKVEETVKKQLIDLVDKSNVRVIFHRNQVDTSLKENYRALLEIVEEHKNNEKAFKIIMSARDSILKEIVEIHLGLTEIQKKSVSFVSESIEKVGIFEYATTFHEEFQKILSKIDDFIQKLSHPEPVMFYAHNEVGAIIAEKRSEKISKRKTDRHPERKSVFHSRLESFEDDVGRLTFMKNTINIILYTTTQLEKEGKEFYSKHHQMILDDSKIHQTYTEYIEQNTGKCQNLLLQCEVFWTELTAECIATLKELQVFKDRYLTTFNNTFFKSKLNKLGTVNEFILSDLVKQEKKMKNNIKEMYDKLRVLYGHPTNSRILHQMEDQFNKFLNANMEVEIKQIINPLKKMLDQGEEQAVTEYNKINSTFVSIKKDNQLTNHIQFLEDQLQIKLMLMEHLTKQDLASCVSMQYTDRKSLDLNIRKDSTVPDSSEIEKLTSLTQSSLITEVSQEIQHNFPEEVGRVKEKYKGNIDQFAQNNLLYHMNNFKDVWGNEIQNILNLYKVKYDKKNIF